jgi:signal transduction histidine kinase
MSLSPSAGSPRIRAQTLLRGSASRRYRQARQLVRTHALIADVVFALLVTVVSTPWLVTTESGPASWLLQAGLLVPLVWRRRYPVGVFAVVCTVALVQWFLGIELVADLSLLVALSTVATYRPRQVSLIAAGILAIGAAMASARWALAGSWLRSLVFLSGLIAAGLLLGISLRARRELVASLTERADRLERERDQQALISAAAERARIAREMHDVIGHQLAVIVNLAEGAGAKLASDPARAAAAITSVAEVGRQALGEARGLLGVLRADGTSDGLAPQPGLARLADLVAQIRATGLTATLDCTGNLAELPPDIELAVYRIAQEAITNTLKHATAAQTVAIRVTASAAGVDIDVTDDGRPAPDPAGSPGPRPAGSGRMTGSGRPAPIGAPGGGPGDGHGGGHGLTGMRERAKAYGGSVTVGPERAGWAVRAHLPTTGRINVP